MKKQAHDNLIEYFQKLIPRYQVEYNNRQRDTDKVIIWLTALSSGAIALILTNSDNLSISNPIFLKISVIFFIVSILFGAAFRSHIYLLEQVESEALMQLETFFYASTSEVNGPKKIQDTDTIEDIANSLKNDMGLDYDHWLDKEYLDRDFWVEHYNSWSEFWGESETDGLKAVGRAFAPLLNKLPEETEDLFLPKTSKPTTSKIFSRYKFICQWSYQFVILFFCFGIISIATGYICT